VNDLPLDSKVRMRLRFELTGTGNVWVDEVQLFDVPFTSPFYRYSEREKLELVKLIHNINRDYGDQQLADCVRALDGYWPRFLMEYLPLVPPAPPNQVAPVAPPPNEPRQAAVPPEQQQQEAPGTFDKFKSWLRLR
jgi:hypothetical protein